MRYLVWSISLLALCSFDSFDEKELIGQRLDAWHEAAARANFDLYFGMMSEDAVFIGTDPTEHWDKKALQTYAKPHFDKGKAWSFKAVQRHIYLDKSGKIAWFDELLNTSMKLCRGSGVLVKVGKEWKIKQYVLSMTIPNAHTNEVVKIIAPMEDAMLEKGF